MVRKVFLFLVGLVVCLVVVGFLLPRDRTFERSIVIDQPAVDIFEVLIDMSQFMNWSPWGEAQGIEQWRVEGPSSGPGSTLVWTGQGGQEGRLWVVSTDRPRRVDLRMELNDNLVDTFFRIESEGFAQRVSWGMALEFGPFDLTGRYVGLFLPRMIGGSYEEGLQRLADYLDTRQRGQTRVLESGSGKDG